MRSEYSVNDGIVRLDDAVRQAARDGMPALGLTDAGNLFGMVLVVPRDKLATAIMLLKREGELAYEIGAIEAASGEPECVIV